MTKTMKKQVRPRFLFVGLVISATVMALTNMCSGFFQLLQHDRPIYPAYTEQKNSFFTSRTVTTGLPGPFYDGKLFLLGMRLSSTIQDDNSLLVDLFAFPGDWFHEGLRSPEPRCQHVTKSSSSLKDTLMTYKDVTENYEFYCQIECFERNATRCDDNKQLLIPMEHVPIHSVDSNQRKSTLIYRCDIARHAGITKRVLQNKGQIKSSLHVHLWIASNQQHNHSQRPKELVTSIDIPLATGVAGHAGPHIVGVKEDYLAQPPITTGLCVAIYGLAIQTYLPEFVQHHKNLGFEQIVIGINATLESEEMVSAQRLLAPFIQEGLVALAAIGVNCEGLSCASRQNLQNLPFYHSCLYHYKGFSKYVGMWDLDEYWMPPKALPPPDHAHEYWQDGYTETEEDAAEMAGVEKNMSWPGPMTSVPHLLARDRLWQASNYSKSVSIGDVMTAVDDYYKQLDCGDSWCYHHFVSYSVQLHDRILDGNQKRTHKIANDFHRRVLNAGGVWQKSVLNTKVAHMGGIHCPGSCRTYRKPLPSTFDPSSSSSGYSGRGDNRECRPRKFRPNVYGSVHHFPNMLNLRGKKPLNSSWPVDEYIERYGSTVVAQLDRLPDEQKKQWEALKLLREKK